MDTSNIYKIWGTRRRILLTSSSEIDLLHIIKDGFCSTHYHATKINRFVVIEGKLKIDTYYGYIILERGEEFEVRPPLLHRFTALEDSTVIELAYVESGEIDANDINRIKQGGRYINGIEMTENEMRDKGLLNI